MGVLLTQEQTYLNANPGKTRADFVAYANETVYTLVPKSTYGYGTVREIASTMLGSKDAGKAFADGLRTWLQSTDDGACFLFMAGNIDFGLQSTQDTIDGIPADGVPSELLDAIRNLGRTGAPRIAGVSLEALETEEAADAAQAIRDQIEPWVNDWRNAVLAGLDSGTITTKEQAKALLV